MIETSQLQTLVAVSKAKSFSKAAEELHVTQSAISQSIKNLEKKIGVKLFKRSGKSVVLTTEGEKLNLLANGFLSQMDDTLASIKTDRDTMTGRVRIGTLNGVGKSWLSSELLDYSESNPELSVCIQLGFQEDLLQSFENYQLDFLILPEESLPSMGERVYLGQEWSTLVVPNHADYKHITPDISLEELIQYPTILFEEEDHLFIKWCREKFGKKPQALTARYIVNSHGNMLQAVDRGLGIAVVPKHVLVRSYYSERLLTLGKQFDVPNGRFYLVYHKGSTELLRINRTLDRLLDSTKLFFES